MPIKTFAPGVLTASDVNTYLMNQAVITCTSATRPASPSEGMTIYETDTDRYLTYTGAAWTVLVGATTTYTPTLYLTQGNGTMTARYAQLGNFYVVQFAFTWGSTTSWGAETTFRFSAPTAIGSLTDGMGYGTIRDDSTGTTYRCEVRPISSDETIALSLNTVSGSYIIGGSMGTTTPFTWAAPDTIFGVCTYYSA